MKITLTLQTPWKGVRDRQGPLDHTLETNGLMKGIDNYSNPPLSEVSVTHSQLQSENIKWKIPEINSKF